jgi:hypothetical protein
LTWLQRFRRSSAHTQANIICTVIITVATCAYAVVAAMQLCEIRRTNALTSQALENGGQSLTETLAEMQSGVDATYSLYDEAQRQTKEAHSLALQARDEATAARDLAKSNDAVMRPWVGVDAVDIIADDPGNQTFSVQVTVRNFGPVPAVNVGIRIRSYINSFLAPIRTAENPLIPPPPPVTLLPGKTGSRIISFGGDYYPEILRGGNRLLLCITNYYEEPDNPKQEQLKMSQEYSYGLRPPPQSGSTWGESGACPAQFQ